MGPGIYSASQVPRALQEQITGAVTVTVPHCLCAVLSQVVGSSSVLPGPLDVFLLAPGTHDHRGLAAFLILEKEKLIITLCCKISREDI